MTITEPEQYPFLESPPLPPVHSAALVRTREAALLAVRVDVPAA